MGDNYSGDVTDPKEQIIERHVEPVPGEVNIRLLETVADVEQVDPIDLPRLYPRLDDVLENLFGEPPIDEAQAEISFSYYGYRITVTQGGTIRMRKLGSLPDEVA